MHVRDHSAVFLARVEILGEKELRKIAPVSRSKQVAAHPHPKIDAEIIGITRGVPRNCHTLPRGSSGS